MDIEILNINGTDEPHSVIEINKDGSCLFGAICYFMYGHQIFVQEIRDEIVRHVVRNWDDFKILTCDSYGNNYLNESSYIREMSLSTTYGSLCELIAAGQMYPYIFEVYREGELYVKCGTDNNPVKRLRFTGNLSEGHFDVYHPCSLQNRISSPNTIQPSRKRRARCTENVRKKQNRSSQKKYKTNHPEPNRAAVSDHQKRNPEVHRAATSLCQRKNLELHRETQAQYRVRLPLTWRKKENSGFEYNIDIDYENDKVVELGEMTHKCTYCNALKWKEESPGLCCSGGKVQLEPLK